MLSDRHIDDFVQAFPALGENEKLLEEIRSNAVHTEIPRGKAICYEKQSGEFLPLLLNGVIRIIKLSETGREISLYHIIRGESCVLTASSLLSATPFPAIAEVEEDAELLLIPKGKVSKWMTNYPAWQHFIFDMFAKRLTEVIAIVEEVAFQRADRRIANLLLMLSRDKGEEISMTHHAIATEIGTAREVVTRVLRDLSSKNVLKLSRGSITILDKPRLRNLSHE